MKSNLVFTLLVQFFFLISYAQEAVYVNYLFTQKTEINNIQLEQNLYATRDRARLDLIPPNLSIKKPEINENEEGMIEVILPDDNKYGVTSYFSKRQENRIFMRGNRNNKQHIVLDDFKMFSWDITSETKKIHGLNAILAKTSFRGRSYNAWFTTEIPIPFGPWKFRGLPGLILEIEDTDKLFSWRMTAIEVLKQMPENIFSQTPTLDMVDQTLEEFNIEIGRRIKTREQEITSKLPRGSSIVESKKLSFAIELEYEWEEEK